MKNTLALSVACIFASLTSAHYTFDQLVVNGVNQGGPNTYIKRHQNGYMPTKFKNIPGGSISPNDPDFTCNKGSTGANQVFTVKAGDKVALKQAFGGTGMAHPGPTQVYVSRTDNPATDRGRGDWYKIHQSLICKAGNPESFRDRAWCSYLEDRVWFTVPATLPDGQYLVRGEHIALHGAHDGQAEFYYACAQIRVQGNTATSIPGKSVKIPGVYKVTDPAVNFSVWGRSTSYDHIPGPPVIPGGTIRGSASGAGGDRTVVVPGSLGDGVDVRESNATSSTNNGCRCQCSASPRAG